jgi:acyl-CoA thioester hydrolase
VVRTHQIEYRRPAFSGEEIIIRTWVSSMEKFSSLRRFEIRRAPQGELLAKAETNWAFVHLQAGRLLPIPPEVRDAFPLVETPPPLATPQP